MIFFSGFAKVSPAKTKFVVLASLIDYLERLFQKGEKKYLFQQPKIDCASVRRPRGRPGTMEVQRATNYNTTRRSTEQTMRRDYDDDDNEDNDDDGGLPAPKRARADFGAAVSSANETLAWLLAPALSAARKAIGAETPPEPLSEPPPPLPETSTALVIAARGSGGKRGCGGDADTEPRSKKARTSSPPPPPPDADCSSATPLELRAQPKTVDAMAAVSAAADTAAAAEEAEAATEDATSIARLKRLFFGDAQPRKKQRGGGGGGGGGEEEEEEGRRDE
jgi:hypothetical protein